MTTLFQISLRYRLATNDRPANSPNMKPNHVFYPIVTAGGGNPSPTLESSLSHSMNEVHWSATSTTSLGSSRGVGTGGGGGRGDHGHDDDNISVLSNDRLVFLTLLTFSLFSSNWEYSSIGSLSTYDTSSSSTWNELRPLTHSQLSRSQPCLLSRHHQQPHRGKKLKAVRSQKQFKNFSEEFPAVDAFLAQSLPTTPIAKKKYHSSS
jgi:hypothetical protein